MKVSLYVLPLHETLSDFPVINKGGGGKNGLVPRVDRGE